MDHTQKTAKFPATPDAPQSEAGRSLKKRNSSASLAKKKNSSPMKGNIVEPSQVANALPEQEEELVAKLRPGDSFRAILSLAESDRTLAEANDVIRGLYHITRNYSSKRTSSTLEFLVVRDPCMPLTLLQYGGGEMRMRPLLTRMRLRTRPHCALSCNTSGVCVCLDVRAFPVC